MHKIILALAAICLVSCASVAADSDANAKAPKKNGKEPVWVNNPRAAYPESQYLSATGYGADKESAEKDALGNLVAIFGQTVKGETTVTSRYAEAVKNGKLGTSEDSEINRAVTSSFDLETVVGAEIKDSWVDTKAKTTWAVAVMDKPKGALLYGNLIEQNEGTIAKLKDIPSDGANTFDAYARYDLAATIADASGRFLNVLSVLSPGMAAAKRGTVSNGDELRLECLKIAQSIPISVSVEGDRDGRLAAAFSSAVSASGFKTGNGSRYALKASVSLSEVSLANNKNKFVRYVIDAKLVDTKRDAVLLPYNVNGREGHATVSEAENRAIRAAEQRISSDFKKAFADYLTQLSAEDGQ